MDFTLGIDGGASATKWALRNEDGGFVEGTSIPIDGHLYREESRRNLETVLSEIATRVSDGKVKSIYAGITGIGSESTKYAEGIFLKVFPNSQLSLIHDIELGYRSNLELGQGIFLYAGTGSIAIHISAKEELFRAGGWGYLLGDEGGGYWIGMQAIRRATLNLDQRTKLNGFSEHILNLIGAKTWDEIKSFVYSKDRSVIASLATDVINLAKSDDDIAKKIVVDAGRHLAELVLQIDEISRNRNLPVVFGGGIKEAGPIICDSISEIINREITISHVNMARRAAELALNA